MKGLDPKGPVPLRIVESAEQCESALDSLAAADPPVIAIDVEHHRAHSREGFVALVQASTLQEDFIFDTMRQAVRDVLCTRLDGLLRAERPLKVFHGALNDVRWLATDFGARAGASFVDTHQVATALGWRHLSLKKVVRRTLGREMSKEEQQSDWRRRPLTPSMVAYARGDTRLLLPAAMHLLAAAAAGSMDAQSEVAATSGGRGAVSQSPQPARQDEDETAFDRDDPSADPSDCAEGRNAISARSTDAAGSEGGRGGAPSRCAEDDTLRSSLRRSAAVAARALAPHPCGWRLARGPKPAPLARLCAKPMARDGGMTEGAAIESLLHPPVLLAVASAVWRWREELSEALDEALSEWALDDAAAVAAAAAATRQWSNVLAGRSDAEGPLGALWSSRARVEAALAAGAADPVDWPSLQAAVAGAVAISLPPVDDGVLAEWRSLQRGRSSDTVPDPARAASLAACGSLRRIHEAALQRREAGRPAADALTAACEAELCRALPAGHPLGSADSRFLIVRDAVRTEFARAGRGDRAAAAPTAGRALVPQPGPGTARCCGCGLTRGKVSVALLIPGSLFMTVGPAAAMFNRHDRVPVCKACGPRFLEQCHSGFARLLLRLGVPRSVENLVATARAVAGEGSAAAAAAAAVVRADVAFQTSLESLQAALGAGGAEPGPDPIWRPDGVDPAAPRRPTPSPEEDDRALLAAVEPGPVGAPVAGLTAAAEALLRPVVAASARSVRTQRAGAAHKHTAGVGPKRVQLCHMWLGPRPPAPSSQGADFYGWLSAHGPSPLFLAASGAPGGVPVPERLGGLSPAAAATARERGFVASDRDDEAEGRAAALLADPILVGEALSSVGAAWAEACLDETWAAEPGADPGLDLDGGAIRAARLASVAGSDDVTERPPRSALALLASSAASLVELTRIRAAAAAADVGRPTAGQPLGGAERRAIRGVLGMVTGTQGPPARPPAELSIAFGASRRAAELVRFGPAAARGLERLTAWFREETLRGRRDPGAERRQGASGMSEAAEGRLGRLLRAARAEFLEAFRPRLLPDGWSVGSRTSTPREEWGEAKLALQAAGWDPDLGMGAA